MRPIFQTGTMLVTIVWCSLCCAFVWPGVCVCACVCVCVCVRACMHACVECSLHACVGDVGGHSGGCNGAGLLSRKNHPVAGVYYNLIQVAQATVARALLWFPGGSL